MSSDDSSRIPLSPDVLPPTGSPPPVKVQRNSPLLPPVNSDSLKVSKRRRLDFSSPIAEADDEPKGLPTPTQITPAKQRSLSSPPKSSARRTPSLQDRPIPVLSPPSRIGSESLPHPPGISKHTRSVSNDHSARVLCISGGHSLSPDSDNIRREGSPPALGQASPRKRFVSSPFFSDSGLRGLSFSQDRNPYQPVVEKVLSRPFPRSLADWTAASTGEKEQVAKDMVSLHVDAQDDAKALCQDLEMHIHRVGTPEEFRRLQIEGVVSGKWDIYDDNEAFSQWLMKYMLKALDIDFDRLFPQGYAS